LAVHNDDSHRGGEQDGDLEHGLGATSARSKPELAYVRESTEHIDEGKDIEGEKHVMKNNDELEEEKSEERYSFRRVDAIAGTFPGAAIGSVSLRGLPVDEDDACMVLNIATRGGGTGEAGCAADAATSSAQ
jgi:hypothetical protein